MKESRREIERSLSKMTDEEIKAKFLVLASCINGNPDLNEELNFSEYQDHMPIELMKEEENVVVLAKEFVNGHGSVILSAEKMVEYASIILSSDTLFEAVCIVMSGDDDTLYAFMESIGAEGRMKALIRDDVYINRRFFYDTLRDYAIAATNLYGVIHVSELKHLIEHYELDEDDIDQYERNDGGYRKSFSFSPKYFSMQTLYSVISNGIIDVLLTLDGYVICRAFSEEYFEEGKKLATNFKLLDRPIDTSDLTEFFNGSSTSYRKLYKQALKFPIFMPEEYSFIDYADEYYDESSQEKDDLYDYIMTTYGDDFAYWADRTILKNLFVKQIIDSVQMIVSDHGLTSFEKDSEKRVEDAVKFLIDTLKVYGVRIEDSDDVKALKDYASTLAKNTRLWFYHGHTADEVLNDTCGFTLNYNQ